MGGVGMIRPIFDALKLWIFFSLILGLGYPLAMMAVGQSLFPFQAGGSLLMRGDAVVGSALVGYPIERGDGYFSMRPSLAGLDDNKILVGKASNLAQTNPNLREAMTQNILDWKQDHPGENWIPSDMAFSSASGLDPDISFAAAMAQAQRVADHRQWPRNQVEALIEKNRIRKPWLGLDFVRVPKLNDELDGQTRVQP